jgi:hypothetical protein
MNSNLYFAVPARIAAELGLTAYRRTDGNGYYMLSNTDLRPYGLERALTEGAFGLRADEGLKKFFFENQKDE